MGGGETGETRRGTEGDKAGKNDAECEADEGCDTGEGRKDRGRSGMRGTLNEGKVGSVALRREKEGHRSLARVETAGIAACSRCDSNVGKESVGDGLVAGEGASATDSRGGDDIGDESADEGGVVSTETSRGGKLGVPSGEEARVGREPRTEGGDRVSKVLRALNKGEDTCMLGLEIADGMGIVRGRGARGRGPAGRGPITRIREDGDGGEHCGGGQGVSSEGSNAGKDEREGGQCCVGGRRCKDG